MNETLLHYPNLKYYTTKMLVFKSKDVSIWEMTATMTATIITTMIKARQHLHNTFSSLQKAETR